ncbi:putative F-box protein At3g17480 [Apium graveolens]|uniref:putative F-box protein At3g17480 n=1 Tax=Apium graveolens TaxID=4045 RepID=UPI003D7AEB79
MEASAGAKRKIIVREKSQLPNDIIHNEILTRIPAKSLLPMQLVCKSWKALFSASTFIQSHLARLHSYQDLDLLIGQKNTPDCGLIIISPSTEINLTAVPLISDVLLGSINGLVCMASGKKFCLWNPALGQLKEVHLQLQHHIDHIESRSFLGFSWDDVHNDYKVVILSHASNPSLFQLTIYSSNSASWTKLVISDSLLPDISISGSSWIKTPSTIVKGLPYWSCSNGLVLDGKKNKYISTFKFVAETNEIRLLPNLNSGTIGRKEFKLVNIRDCLFGMVYKGRYEDNMVDIYSLDEESHTGVWSKIDSIGPINIFVGNLSVSQCFKNGGEILIDGFLFGSLCVYDPETGLVKRMKSRGCSLKRCFSYMPSLVCVQGMESMQVLKNGVVVHRAQFHNIAKKAIHISESKLGL